MQKKTLKHIQCARPDLPDTVPEEVLRLPSLIHWVNRHHIKELPVLQHSDGSLWKEGVGFLISRMYDLDFNRTTLSTDATSRKADDLSFFINSLETLGIDFKADERFKTNRPTYAFLRLLNEQVTTGAIAETSARRIIGTIIEFYRWLEFQTRLQFTHPLWIEYTRTRIQLDDKGVSVETTYVTTDLMETIKKATSPRDPNFVIDGGKLKPLTEAEQTVTAEALYESKNTEMILGFFVAIATSARIQTAFTLRARSFREKLHPNQVLVRVHTGKGTGVDTKKGKKHYLEFPAWLYNKIHIYIHSERYLVRSYNCLLPKAEKYVFYTSKGNPYYSSGDDYVSENHKGSAVRVYMTERLFPIISKLGHSFRFRFHDLRATYCINRLDEGLESVERGETTVDSVLRGIQDAMGHSDIRITYRYLNYRNLNPLINNANKAWTGKILADIVETLDKKYDAS